MPDKSKPILFILNIFGITSSLIESTSEIAPSYFLINTLSNKTWEGKFIKLLFLDLRCFDRVVAFLPLGSKDGDKRVLRISR